MHFQDVGIPFGFTVIEVFGQVTFRQDLLRVQHKISQQAKLGSGELDVDTGAGHTLAAFVQLQAGSFQGRLVGQATGTTQQRLDAQLQFFRVKRLAQVVIGAGFEALDALGPGPTRGEDQHRCRQPRCTPLGQHFKARQAGQAEVQNDQVVRFAATLVDRIPAVSQPVDRIALALQALGQFICQRHVVLDQ
ncbi:hypothetical protein D3C79_717910 [compost metagenome]